MRVLVVYCHPVETSFHAALHQEVLRNLRAAGHEVDDCDLYAEGFDPVMSREERLVYHEVPGNQAPLAGYVERLRRADALVLCFPTWCFGLPAMLKGFSTGCSCPASPSTSATRPTSSRCSPTSAASPP